jgi:Phage integrase SAM-like domain
MATFKIVLDKRLEVEKDKFHLVVRVSHQGSNIYLRLGSQMTVKEYEAIFTKKSFDKKINSIKESYQKYITRAEKIFEDVKPFNQPEFRKKYFDKTFDLDKIVTPEMKEMGSIVYLFKNYIKVKTESKEIGLSTAQLLQGTLNNLNKFKVGLTYEDITPEFLHTFEHWYLNKDGKKNSLASFGGVCRNIKAVLNYHRKKKIIPLTYEYPFNDFKIPNFVPPKRVISNAEIQKIINCKEFDNYWEEYARDIWVFLYRMNGINFIDALKLRWDNQQGNKFVFYRHKTRRTRRNNIRAIEVKVSPKIQEVLDKIGDTNSPFVLGLISDEDYTEQYLNNKNHKLKVKVNHYLKKIGKRLRLSMSLDISLARDAYANTHKRAGTNPLVISENMNHSDPRTTTLHYLDNFEFDSDVDVNDVLL